jgi:hypothetical protein
MNEDKSIQHLRIILIITVQQLYDDVNVFILLSINISNAPLKFT